MHIHPFCANTTLFPRFIWGPFNFREKHYRSANCLHVYTDGIYLYLRKFLATDQLKKRIPRNFGLKI